MSKTETATDLHVKLTGDEAHKLAQLVLVDIEAGYHKKADYVQRLGNVIRAYGDDRAKAGS